MEKNQKETKKKKKRKEAKSIRRSSHHLHKLVEIDSPIPIPINAFNHLLAILQRHLLPHPSKNLLQLLGRDQSVPIQIKDRERPPQILLHATRRIDPGPVDRDELLQTDVPVSVEIRNLHHRLDLLRRPRIAKGSEHRFQLGRGDPAIAVGIASVENLAKIALALDAAGVDGRRTGCRRFG